MLLNNVKWNLDHCTIEIELERTITSNPSVVMMVVSVMATVMMMVVVTVFPSNQWIGYTRTIEFVVGELNTVEDFKKTLWTFELFVYLF